MWIGTKTQNKESAETCLIIAAEVCVVYCTSVGNKRVKTIISSHADIYNWDNVMVLPRCNVRHPECVIHNWIRSDICGRLAHILCWSRTCKYNVVHHPQGTGFVPSRSLHFFILDTSCTSAITHHDCVEQLTCMPWTGTPLLGQPISILCSASAFLVASVGLKAYSISWACHTANHSWSLKTKHRSAQTQQS